jgi:hypothetical protein
MRINNERRDEMETINLIISLVITLLKLIIDLRKNKETRRGNGESDDNQDS